MQKYWSADQPTSREPKLAGGAGRAGLGWGGPGGGVGRARWAGGGQSGAVVFSTSSAAI